MSAKKAVFRFVLASSLSVAGLAVLFGLLGATQEQVRAAALDPVIALVDQENAPRLSPRLDPVQSPVYVPPAAPLYQAIGAASVITVCKPSAGSCDYTSVQAAVNAAVTGDIIKVAQGVYNDIQFADGVVYITQTLTLRGGYTTTGVAAWTISDPDRYPTVLDGGTINRVVYVADDDIAPVIEGFYIQNGDADNGAGVYIGGGSPQIRRNRIYDNQATGSGGGIYVAGGSSVLENNLFYANTAASGGGARIAGSVFVRYNTFYGNQASSGSGGGLLLASGAPTVSASIIVSNLASIDGGGIFREAGDPTVEYNDVFGNVGENYGGFSLLPPKDIHLDPLFVDLSSDNFHLQKDSPCIIQDAADAPSSYPADDYDSYARPFGPYPDIGALEYYTGTCFAQVDSGRVYTTVQEAVDAFTVGEDEVIKVAGLCTASAGASVVHLDKSLTLRGGYTLTNWVTPNADAYPTILDGEGVRRGIYIESIAATVEGFHIYNGYAVWGSNPSGAGIYVKGDNNQASVIRYNWIYSNTVPDSSSFGGGIFIGGGRPTIQGNEIYSNVANPSNGGGIYIGSGNGGSMILDNHIHHNTTGGDFAGKGAGIYVVNNANFTTTIQGNKIHHNTAFRPGGGIHIDAGIVLIRDNTISTNTSGSGGGIYARGTYVIVEDNRVYENSAVAGNGTDQGGGGIYAFGNVLVQRNVIFDNVSRRFPGGWQPVRGGGVFAKRADSGTTSRVTIEQNSIFGNAVYDAHAQGGGIYILDRTAAGESLVLVQNNLVYSNTADEEGGGIAVRGNSVIDGNTIYANQSNTNEGGGINRQDGDPIARNNIVVNNNSYGIYSNIADRVIVEYNDVWGNAVGGCYNVDCNPGTTTNLAADPLFEDSGAFDFRLQSGSPCIDAITVITYPVYDYDNYARPFGQYADMGAHEFYAGTCFARLSTGGQVYATVQDAIDVATAGVDDVLVAGVCQGTAGMATINDELALSGGYTKSNWIEPTYPTILDADGSGRVIAISAGSPVTIERFVVMNGDAGGGNGGGINVAASLSPTIQNIMFYNNSAANGGGFASSGGNPRLYNNTFVGNSSGIYLSGSGTPGVRNNMVVNNTGNGIHAASGSAPVLAYNDVQGNGSNYVGLTAGVTDISEPPVFVAPAGPIFRLAFDSAGVHMGDPGTGVAVDFEGNDRPDGTGVGVRYDIGADEATDYLGVSLGPDDPGGIGFPSEEIPYTYYLTNTGTRDDKFDISNMVTVSGTGSANDWTVTYHPAYALSADEAVEVPVTVIVPDSSKVSSGTLATIILTATYQSGGEYFFDVTTSTILVQNNWGFDVSPQTDQATVDPGQTFTYTHVLTNNGNEDSFLLALNSDLGWVEDIPSVIQNLGNKQSTSIDIIVHVPITASGDAVEVATVVITSEGSIIAGDPFYAVVTDTTHVADLDGNRYVATDGSDDNGYNSCRISDFPCQSIGQALGQANSSEIIRVQQGTYYEYGLSLNAAYVLRGGYPDGDWTLSDPGAYPTIIDAQAKGRVLQINGNATVERFTLQNGKVSNEDGGGVYIAAVANPILQRNVIVGNRARHGAGVYNAGGNPDIWNNFIYDNVSDDDGGGFYNAGGNPRVRYNTFIRNTADRGGGVFLAGGSPAVRNTIIFSNTARDTDGGGGVYYQSGSLGYNDVGDNTPNDYTGTSGGSHSISDNPLFVDATVGDLHLLKASTCRNVGETTTVPTKDIDGQPRTMDGAPDMGADEFQRADVALLSLDPVQTWGEGMWVTYTHRLTNTGNWNDSFLLTYHSTLTEGWTVAGVPLTTPVMAKDAVTNVNVLIQVPTDTLSGTVNSTIVTATSLLDPEVSDGELNLTIVERDVDVSLEPNRVGWTTDNLAAYTVVYTHTLTNEGNYTDTFDLSVSGTGGTQPWIDLPPVPSSVELPMGGSAVITVGVDVPVGEPEATAHTTFVTATSRADGSVTDVVTDTTVAWRTLTMNLAPNSVGSAYTKQPVYHNHILTNNGNYTDTYRLTYTSVLGWPAKISVDGEPFQTPPVLVKVGAWPGTPGSRSIQVQVSIPEPPDAFGGQMDTMQVTATSVDTPTMSSSVTDVTTATQREGVEVWPEYDDLLYEDQSETADEKYIKRVVATSGQLVTFTHQLINNTTSNSTDTFDIALASFAPDLPGFSASVTPSPDTGVMAWHDIITDVVVTFTVPAVSAHPASAPTATVLLEATSWFSPTGPNGRDTVTDVLIVNQWVEASWTAGSDRWGPVEYDPPGADGVVAYSHMLTNEGNYTDSFELTFESDWGEDVEFGGAGVVEQGGRVRTPDIGAGQSHLILVTATVPFARCYVTGTVVITATSRTGPDGIAVSNYNPTVGVRDPIHINDLYYVDLGPALVRRYISGTATITKTYTHWMTNTGNCDNSFTLDAQGNFNPAIQPGSTGVLSSWLEVDNYIQLVSITVELPSLAGLVVGEVEFIAVGLNGAASDDDVVTDTVILNQRVIAALEADDSHTVTEAGQEQVLYNHTLTNTGNYTDTFEMTWWNEDGWPVTVDGNSNPFPVVLGAGATEALQVAVTVGAHADVPPTVTNRTWLTATSLTPENLEAVAIYSPTDTVVDTTNVRRPHVTISPDFDEGVPSGDSHVYTHTLKNTGGVMDSYNISCAGVAQVPSWLVDCTPASVVNLTPGQTQDVLVTVAVPGSAVPGDYDVTVITATSYGVSYALDIFDVATDTTSVEYILDAELSPEDPQYVAPDTIVTFTHKLTNTGNYAEPFTLTVDGGFNPSVVPAVISSLSPEQATDITVTVAVPAYAPGGQAKQVEVKVWGTNQATGEYQRVETGVDTIYISYTVGTRYVDPTGADENNNCTRRDGKQPCQTVQYAVNQASHGDTVKVAEGTYVDELDADQVVWVDKSITLIGGFASGGVDWDNSLPFVHRTALDAEGRSGRRVMVVAGGITPTIEGFDMLGGFVDGDGAGLYITQGATPTVRLNRIYNNESIGAHRGGGIYFGGGDALLERNAIYDNEAYLGGGLYLEFGESRVWNNVVYGNASNSGGGFYNGFGTPQIWNSTFYNNVADSGGGLFGNAGRLIISNTIVANNADYGIRLAGSASYTLSYNDVWGNSNGGYYWSGGAIIPDPGSISQDPRFAGVLGDTTGTGLRITFGSPCINRGDPDSAALPVESNYDYEGNDRTIFGRRDIGAYEYGITGTKTVPNTAPVNTNITYTIRMTNTGNVVHTIRVTDTLHEYLDPTGVLDYTAGDGEYLLPSRTISWTGPVSTVVQITFTAHITEFIPNYTVITNVAWIDYGPAETAEFTAMPAPGTRYVTLGGSDDSDCRKWDDPCQTVQYAVGQAQPGDEVKVAAGTYNAAATQVVSISRDIILSGGYPASPSSESAWNDFDPSVRATILDAQSGKPGVVISGSNATLAGLHIINGTDGVSVTNSSSFDLYRSWVHNNVNGLRLNDTAYTFINSIIAQNGTGLDVSGASDGTMIHDTFADNDTGASIVGPVYVTNTIFSTHTTAIAVTAGSAELWNTLWWENTNDATGNVISHTSIFTGNPRFVDATEMDYHILEESDAVDVGVPVDPSIVSEDIDGEARIVKYGPDIGADEYPLGLTKTGLEMATPDQTITYTIELRAVDTGLLITDVLPIYVTFTSPTNTLTCTAGACGISKVAQTQVITWAGDSTGVVFITYTVDLEPWLGYGEVITNSAMLERAGRVDESEAWETVITQVPGTRYVAPGGFDAKPDGVNNNCLVGSLPCATVQQAVDQAMDGDTVLVAGGTYTSTASEVVRVNKAVMLIGGCTASDWACNPDVYPTYLDGEDSRRVIHIVGTGGPVVVDGFHLRNGSASGNGGGIRVEGTAVNIATVELTRNRIYDNAVPTANGGGLYLLYADATLDANWVYNNTANSIGGGMYASTSDLHLLNNVFAGNQAGNQGGGLYLDSPIGSSASMVHNTIADNGQEGMRVYRNFAVVLTNTIVSGHTSYGIYNDSSNVVLNRTLWYGNVSDGFNIVDNDPVLPSGDPLFRDPSAWDYHIRPGSPAFDAALDVSIGTDIDDEPRPMGHAPDVGADELRVSLAVTKDGYPHTVEPSDGLLYTIYVTNTGLLTLTATINDILPSEVTTSDPTSWPSVSIVPDDTWTETISVTVNAGVSGIITNEVQVNTAEGAMGTCFETTLVTDTPDITVAPLVLTATLNPGDATTQTLTIGNVGRADLDWWFEEDPEVNWLNELPTSGSVAPLGTVDVDVVFTASPPVGFYETTLWVNSNDPDDSQVEVSVGLTVTETCIAVYNVSFDFTPAAPATGELVSFTGTAAGTSPISYTWNFGDGSGETAPSINPVATHSFNRAMTYTVMMTATNSCSGDGVMFSGQVPVYQTDYSIYLPVVMRNYVTN